MDVPPPDDKIDGDGDRGVSLVASEVAGTGDDEDLSTEIATVAAELAQLSRSAKELINQQTISSSSSTALELAGGIEVAHNAKARLAHMNSEVAHRRSEIEAKKQQLRDLMDRQAQLALDVLAPLQKLAKQLADGIWSVNLYLGKDEEITTLIQGSPAPADTPIVLRQLVLAMDQECAVAASEGGIDAVSMGGFDDWLREDPAHLDQVAPEQRCIVALVPRYGAKEYRDPGVSDSVAMANRQTYILIRNGQRVWRLCPDMVVGSKLVPARDEFTKMFQKSKYNFEDREYKVSDIKPGGADWERAVEQADNQHRHYMRVALTLQGILDRTAMMHPLPVASVNLLQPESYDSGHVLIVTDAELSLGDGQLRFRDWQRESNARLRPGMRIVGQFGGYSYKRSDVDERKWPANAEDPKSGHIYTITRRESNGNLVLTYERYIEQWLPTGQWKEMTLRVPSTRASYTLHPQDGFVLSYDELDPTDIDRWLKSRIDRTDYVSMFPVLKAAKRALQVEIMSESPFRCLLIGQLMEQTGVDVEIAETVLPELVRWYKITNIHHRALVGESGADQNKAIRMIIAEYKRRTSITAMDIDPEILKRLRDLHSDAIMIARKTDGQWVVVVPEQPDRNIWGSEYIYSKTGKPHAHRSWSLSGRRSRHWRIVYQTARWDDWNMQATNRDNLSDPDIEMLVEQIRAEGSDRALSIGIDIRDNGDGKFRVWYHAQELQYDSDAPLTGSHVEPRCACYARDWTRDNRGRPQLAKTRWHAERYSFEQRIDRWPFVLGPKDQAPYDWHKQRIVWVDHLNVKTYIEQVTQWDAHIRRYRQIASKVDRTLGALNGKLEERYFQEQYDRFIVDFKDPTLWPAHRKTLTSPRPPDELYNRGTGFNTLLYLYQAGIDPAGMTLQEAAIAAVAVGDTNIAEYPRSIRDLVLPGLPDVSSESTSRA